MFRLINEPKHVETWRDVNHSHTSSAEVRERSCTSTPPIRLHGVHKDNFTVLHFFFVFLENSF